MFLAKLRQAFLSLVSPNAFVAQGRLGRPGWRRALATFALAPLGYAGLLAVMLAVGWMRHHKLPTGDVAAASAELARNPRLAFQIVLGAFGAPLAGLLAGVRFLQKRPVASLLHVLGRAFRWRRWLLGFALTMGVNLFSTLLVRVLDPSALAWSFAPHAFFATLPWVVVGLAVQTLAEEVVFRAWLPQTLAGPKQRVALAATLSALLFFAAHLGNPEVSLPGALVWKVAPYAMLSALLTVVALREEGLELAWGIHLANNLACACLVGAPGGVFPSSIALFQAPRLAATAADMVPLLLLAGLVLASLRRRGRPSMGRGQPAFQTVR